MKMRFLTDDVTPILLEGLSPTFPIQHFQFNIILYSYITKKRFECKSLITFEHKNVNNRFFKNQNTILMMLKFVKVMHRCLQNVQIKDLGKA